TKGTRASSWPKFYERASAEAWMVAPRTGHACGMPDSLQHLPADAPATELIAALERDGAVIIDDLLDADLLARFNTELDPLLTAPPAHGEFINPAIEFFFGSNTRHITAVPAKSRVFSEEILINPALLSICDAILGPSCASYQLNLAH